MRRGNITYPTILLVVVLMGVVLVSAGYLTYEGTKGTRPRGAPEVEHPDIFMLPKRAFAAAAVLQQPREKVRGILGAPVESLDAIDVFQVGIVLVRARYEKDRAVGLLLTVPNARRNERAMRRWVSIPNVDPVVLDGIRYDVRPLAGEDDSLEISPSRSAPPPSSSPRTPAAPRVQQRLAGELLRAFPEIPPDVAAQCRQQVSGGTTQLVCDRGLDAKVLYEFDATRTFTTMTILNPPVSREEEACAAYLKGNAKGAVSAGRLDDTARVTAWFAAGGNEFLYSWLKTVDRRSGGPCSIMACHASAAGLGTECRSKRR